MSQYLRGTTKVKKLRRRGRGLIYLTVGAIVLVLPMLLIAAKQSALLTVGYQVTELRDETAALREERARLRTELASLLRPQRVWWEARSLGLVPLSDKSRIAVRVIDAEDSDSDAKQLIAGIGQEP